MILEMTTSAFLCSWRFSRSPATSAEAGQIASAFQDSCRHLCASQSFGASHRASLEELSSVAEECKKPNWDGQGAAAISSETYLLAYKFIEALPIGIPVFSISAEPDGHLTFEWFRSSRRLLSVSIGPQGELHYAASLGLRKRYGTEPFFGEVPGVVLELVSEVLAK
jgi:hypothetical protein